MSARRIMRAFKLAEISGVDLPAQKGAVVSILKRDDGEDHARVKGATSSPDVSKSKEFDMSIKKALGLPETATDAEVTAAVEKNAKAIADAATAKATSDAEIAKLKADIAKAGMSNKHQAFCDSDDATMPKGGKGAFVAMSPSERDDHMKANPIKGGGDSEAEKRAFALAVAKAAANDEVLKVGQLEIRKSAVGEDMFAVFKAQQAEITKERDARELLEFSKMADTLYPALPGDSIAKAKMLRDMQKMPEPERKVLETMLKSGNDARKVTFKEIGKGGGNGDDMPVNRLEALAKVYAKENKTTVEKAYTAVLDTDEGRALYNESRRTGATS